MKYFKQYLMVATLFLPSVFLMGCTNQPTLGDKMISQGAETEDIGEQWVDGKKMVEKGQSLIEDGQEKISKGEKLKKEGQQKIEDSESQYKERFPLSSQRIYQ